jgi:3-isopropylmalate dehydrogenase
VHGALEAGFLTADLASGKPAVGTHAATAAVIEQLQLPCQVPELRD